MKHPFDRYALQQPSRKGLTTSGAPHGCHPKAGDIASYSPWRNIAIYYRDGSSYSSDMIPLRRIEGDISTLKTSGSLNVRFEIIKNNPQKIDNYE